MLVLMQWAFQELTFNRGTRLITGSSTTDFDFNREVAAQRADRATHVAQPVETTR